MSVKARALRPGDRIAVVAPASPFPREDFDEGIAELSRLGFTPVYDETVFARDGYVAGTPETRASAIMRAWQDPDIAALIGVRGGYGSAQVLPHLNRDVARRARKAVIGYSDLTALLTFLTIGCDQVAFHGPMLAGRLGRGSSGRGGDGAVGGYDRRSLLDALCRTEPLGELAPPGLDAVRDGDARGVLLGGNLAQLVSSLGTPFAFSPPEGYVLFLEEVGERPYRLDRMVTQLAQAGVIGRASAIVIGDLRDCDEPGGAVTGRGVMADLFKDFPGPVLAGFPSGHTAAPSITLPLGVACRVVGGARPRLVVEEAAVE